MFSPIWDASASFMWRCALAVLRETLFVYGVCERFPELLARVYLHVQLGKKPQLIIH